MVIELLGTRLTAPFYGASLYVWISVISVTLIALVLGYYIGGHWADRARNTGLALIIALSGLLTLLIPWLTGPILLATDSLGLRMGVFVSTLVLFSPSLIMLGMIGPFAAKLATSSLEGVGASAGSIYAVSTIGSVIGTLFLGFYLFPQAGGSREIFLGLGIALFLLALGVAYFERKHLSLIITLPPVAVLTAIGIILLPRKADSANVFTGGSEPTHLLTVEALAQLHGLLTNQGILALNFVSFLDNGKNAALASVVKTLARIFPINKYLFPIRIPISVILFFLPQITQSI